MATLKRKIGYALWTLNGHVGRTISLDDAHKATVLVTYYSPERLKYIDSQVRNILKCNFVDRLILSSHNPAIQIEDKVKVKDKRLVFVNQEVKRGCGYRWLIAHSFDPTNLIVIDDDILLFPHQLSALFKYLIIEPEIPHGYSGILHLNHKGLEFHEGENMTVDYLCEVYAVTGRHLKRYFELKRLVASNDALSEMIESAADFMVISQTGNRNPKIHKVDHLFRSETFREVGIAVHKNESFDETLSKVGQALKNIGTQGK